MGERENRQFLPELLLACPSISGQKLRRGSSWELQLTGPRRSWIADSLVILWLLEIFKFPNRESRYNQAWLLAEKIKWPGIPDPSAPPNRSS